MDGPQSVTDCKTVCANANLNWQWINFDNNVCYCIQLLEKGNFSQFYSYILYSIRVIYEIGFKDAGK